MPRGGQSSGCGREIRRRFDRRPLGLGPSANPSADSVLPACGGNLADRTTSLDGPPPELAAGRPRSPDHRSELIAAPQNHDGVRLFHSVVCPGLLAHREHWPGLRRPGAGTDRQQNKTSRRRSNQGPAEQGTSSFARNCACGTPFPCAARPVSESVNLMGELTTNRQWDTGPRDLPSRYARMIPGTSAILPSQSAPATSGPAVDAPPTHAVNMIDEPKARHAAARPPTQPNLTQPGVDRFTLFELVAADLVVLVTVCGALTLFSPAWGLPWPYLPIFAVLVTLFGLREGLYIRAGDPSPAGVAPALAGSILFAMVLVFIAAWDGMRPLAAARIFASSLAGLALLRRLRQVVWKRRRRETEARNILIIGGGPVARSIARALRNDPLHRAIVCGFVDDNQPLSPVVLGRLADLDWLARAEFIDEVILALPGQPAQTREAAEAAFRNHLDIRAVPDLPPGPWPDSGIDR